MPASATFAGPLLASTSDTFSVQNHLIQVDGAATLTSTTESAFITAVSSVFNVGVGTIVSGLLEVCCFNALNGVAGSVNLNGPLLSATDSTFVLTGSAIEVSNGARLTAPATEDATLIQLANTSLTLAHPSFTVSVLSLFGTSPDGSVPASVEVGGVLFADSGSSVSTSGHVINVGGGASLRAWGAPAIHLDGATLTVDTNIICCDGQPFRNGLLGVSDLGPGGALRSTATIEGELLRARNATVSLNGNAINVSGGGRLVAEYAPLIRLDNTSLAMPTTAFSSVLGVFNTNAGVHSSAEISGGLLVATNSSTLAMGSDLINLNTGGSLTASGVPLIQLEEVALDLHANFSFNGAPVNVGLLNTNDTGTTVSIAAGLLLATDASITMTNNAISVGNGATLTATSTPLLDLVRAGLVAGNASTFASLVNLYSSPASSSATITGGVLRATDGSFVTVSGPAINLYTAVSLTASDTPLIQLDASDLASGNAAISGGLLGVNGDGGARATASITGGLLTASYGSTITVRGNAINVFQGDLTLGSVPAIDLCDSSLTVLNGHLVAVSGAGTLTTAGEILKVDKSQVSIANDAISVFDGSTVTASKAPLLRAIDSTLTIGGQLVNAQGDNAITTTAPSCPAHIYPLVALDFSGGGQLNVAANAIVAQGFATQDHEDPEFGTIPSLGTDRPIRHQGGGAMLEITGSRTNLESETFDVQTTGNAVRVDTALLEATAPLLALTQTAVKTGGDAVNIFQRARVEAGGDLLRLDRSRLDVVSGHLVNVAGGSLLRANNLLSVSGGSRVNIFNGTLLNVVGNSFASVAGCLICFNGSNNVVNVTNSIPSTGLLFGDARFPIAGTVQVGAGATAATVFPGLGSNGNQLNVSGSGVLLNVGGGSTLKLQ
jgi:hypothetical protein